MAEAFPEGMEVDSSASSDSDSEENLPSYSSNGLTGIRNLRQISGGCFATLNSNKFDNLSNLQLVPDLAIREALEELQAALDNFNIDLQVINYSFGDYQFNTTEKREFMKDIDCWSDVLYRPGQAWKLTMHVSIISYFLLLLILSCL
jgi:hypothetical protein